MKRIRINSPKYGVKYAIVDNEDFELVSKYRWCLSKGRMRTSGDVSFYAVTTIRKEGGGRTMLQMHRLILGLDFGDGRIADHINFKTLDNRRCNLRACSPLESVRHRKKMDGTSSKYKGVHYCQKYKNWISHITIERKAKHLGSFKTQKEAAIQYDKAAFAEFGEFADLNFPKASHSKDGFDIRNFETPAKSRESSKYVGASWDKSRGKWASYIRIDRKPIHLGRFENEGAAAKARDDYIIKHKLDRKLNFGR